MSDPTPAGEAEEYDAFVAYCEHDKTLARDHVLLPLRAAKLRIATRADGELGATIIGNLESAIEKSRHTLAIVTRHYLCDALCGLMDNLAMTLDPSAVEQRFIPLLFEDLSDCEGLTGKKLPLSIRRLSAANLFDPDEREAALNKLLLKLCGGRKALNAASADSAQRGAESLPYFAAAPAVAGKVHAFGEAFARACAKMARIVRDKFLHDDFHRAQDAFALLVISKRELIDELAASGADADDIDLRWENLEKAMTTLQIELAAAKARARAAAGPGAVPIWVTMLDEAEAAVLEGISAKPPDIEAVKEGAAEISRTIKTEPTKLNQSLVEKAKELPLKDLIARQRDILADLEGTNPSPEARERIETCATGVQALVLMDETLERLLWNHNALQNIDNKLQPLDDMEQPALADIRSAWRFTLEPVRQLKPASWMTDLHLPVALAAFEAAFAQYEQAQTDRDLARAIRRSSDKLRKAIGKGFSRTDEDLKALCEELNRFGAPSSNTPAPDHG